MGAEPLPAGICPACGDKLPEGRPHDCWVQLKRVEQEVLPEPPVTARPEWVYGRLDG